MGCATIIVIVLLELLQLGWIEWVMNVNWKWTRREREKGALVIFHSFLQIQKVQPMVQIAKVGKNCFSITEVQPWASGGAYHLYILLFLVTKHQIYCVYKKRKRYLKYVALFEACKVKLAKSGA